MRLPRYRFSYNLKGVISENEGKFLSATNHHHFKGAQLLFRKRQRLAQLYHDRFFAELAHLEQREGDHRVNSSWTRIRQVTGFLTPSHFTFPKNIPAEKQEAVIDAFVQMAILLSDHKQCIDLYKELDGQIAAFQPFLKCDFTQFTPGAGLFLANGLWAPNKSRLPSVNTHDLLRYLMRRKLQTHHIETQDKLYTFSGFVDAQKADNIVRNGALFKEQFLMGASLLHGLNVHYLQWYLFAAAVEKKLLSFEKDLTLRDMISAMIDVKDNSQYDFSAWNSIIDSINRTDFKKTCDHFYLGDPHRLNSFLQYSADIPHLRGYMLNEHHEKIKKFQQYFEFKYSKKIPYACIMGGQAVAYNFFGMFDVGFTNATVDEYYQQHFKGKYTFNQSEGILIESAKEQFSIVDKEYKRMVAASSVAATQHGIFSRSKLSVKNLSTTIPNPLGI